MAAHSSILAWRVPGTEEPGQAWTIGSERAGYNCSNSACTHTITYLQEDKFWVKYIKMFLTA